MNERERKQIQVMEDTMIFTITKFSHIHLRQIMYCFLSLAKSDVVKFNDTVETDDAFFLAEGGMNKSENFIKNGCIASMLQRK